MKLFSGLASALASLSGDMLRSISRPSRDPAAGVIEQTSGCTHCPPFSRSLAATVMRQRKREWERDVKSVFQSE